MSGGPQPGYDGRGRIPCCVGFHSYYYRNVSQPSPGSGLILAIESSCDETAAAVVERGHRILSSIVASQIAIHAPYGGVVPELASREHLRNIVPVVRAAVAQASVSFSDLDAIAERMIGQPDAVTAALAAFTERTPLLVVTATGLDAERTLLVPDPGPGWPQVVASLLDGCELVLLRLPARAPGPGSHGAQGAQVRQRLEATLRRGRGVLLVVGDWPGAQVRLRVLTQGWTGLGDGHGRLRACCAQVMADGRGEAAVPRTRWLWLPGEDGRVTVAEPADIPVPGAGLALVSGG